MNSVMAATLTMSRRESLTNNRTLCPQNFEVGFFGLVHRDMVHKTTTKDLRLDCEQRLSYVQFDRNSQVSNPLRFLVWFDYFRIVFSFI